MQARAILIIATLVAAAAVLAARSAAQPAPPHQRWEYASLLRSDAAAAWQTPDASAVAPDVFGVPTLL